MIKNYTFLSLQPKNILLFLNLFNSFLSVPRELKKHNQRVHVAISNDENRYKINVQGNRECMINILKNDTFKYDFSKDQGQSTL